MDSLKEVKSTQGISYTSLLTRGLSATETTMEVAGVLHCTESSIDVLRTNANVAGTAALDMLVDLPAYPFDHTKYFRNEGRLSRNSRFRKASPHELLGTAVSDWNHYEVRWTNRLGATQYPWVKHHRVCPSAVAFGNNCLLTFARQTTPYCIRLPQPKQRVPSRLPERASSIIISETLCSARPQCYQPTEVSKCRSRYAIQTMPHVTS